jgi:hypothetical protein
LNNFVAGARIVSAALSGFDGPSLLIHFSPQTCSATNQFIYLSFKNKALGLVFPSFSTAALGAICCKAVNAGVGWIMFSTAAVGQGLEKAISGPHSPRMANRHM